MEHSPRFQPWETISKKPIARKQSQETILEKHIMLQRLKPLAMLKW